jgi:hypothetical protein
LEREEKRGLEGVTITSLHAKFFSKVDVDVCPKIRPYLERGVGNHRNNKNIGIR